MPDPFAYGRATRPQILTFLSDTLIGGGLPQSSARLRYNL
jgi:hypothetical protein